MLVAGSRENNGAVGLTVSDAVRVWLSLVPELIKVMVASYVLAARLFAFAFTVKVTVVPDDAVPEVDDGVSQLGTPEIEYVRLPLVALSV